MFPCSEFQLLTVLIYALYIFSAGTALSFLAGNINACCYGCESKRSFHSDTEVVICSESPSEYISAADGVNDM